MKFAISIICTAIALTACGKDEKQTADSKKPGESADKMEAGYYMADQALKKKEVQGFGMVSAIDLKPIFNVPEKYQAYNRVELTEMDFKEIQAQNIDNRDYQENWLKQASSVEKPDWWNIAATKNPDIRSTTNDFKKQEEANKEKLAAQIDKKNTNVIVTFDSGNFSLSKPNILDEEYYVRMLDKSDNQGINSEYNGISYSYSYSVDLEKLRIARNSRDCDNRNTGCYYDFTLKVPKEQAKKIEEARESGKDIFRFYGRVQQVKDWNVTPKHLRGNMVVDVEALEIGSRQNGKFIQYLFIDTDQFNLMKIKQVKTKQQGMPGI